MKGPAAGEQRRLVVPESSNVFDVPIMKLLSSEEKSRLEKAFVFMTGLRRDQFAMNSWGFPFIPIPEPRENNGRVRLAPSNLRRDFMGHPIYWIDPELTAWNPEEEPEEHWCIRMFYLIMAFGLWGKKDTRQWVDFIQWRMATMGLSIDFTDDDYDAYHLSNIPPSRFDQLQLLRDDDMRIPESQWSREFEETIRRCSEKLEDQVGDFFMSQATALSNALVVFGENANLHDPKVRPTSDGGWWATQVHPRLEELDSRYRRAMRGSSDVQGIGEPLAELIDDVVRQMTLMEQSIALIMVPVIRTATTESEAFSEMLSYYRLGLWEAAKGADRWNYDAILRTLFMEYPTRRDGVEYSLKDLARAMHDDYRMVWERLRVAVFNYESLRTSGVPMTDYASLDAYLTAGYGDAAPRPDRGASGAKRVTDEDIADALEDGDLSRLGMGQVARDDDDIQGAFDEEELLNEMLGNNKPRRGGRHS